MDYQNVVHTIIDEIIPQCKNVQIQTNEEGRNVNITISADSENISRLIGKKGVTANSIREIMNIIGRKNNQFIHVYFSSNEELTKKEKSEKQEEEIK